MVRRLLVVYVLVLAGALLWSRVEAATVPATLPATVSYKAGAYSINGTVTSGALSTVSTVALGGGSVASFPVMYRLGTLAGVAVKTALRANAVVAGAQTLVWLGQYGLKQCQSSGWCVETQQPGSKANLKCADLASGASTFGYYTYSGNKLWGWYSATTKSPGQVTAPSGYGGTYYLADGICSPTGGSYNIYFFVQNVQNPPPVNTVPATDADWAKVPTTGIPDTVLQGVMTEGKQWLPATPEVTTAVQTVPLSNVYKDPTTGTSYRDFAYVTPNDPQSANLQVVKTQVDPATGNPVTDPNTGNTTGTTKQEDPCTANPNRVGCMDKGDIPDAPDLLKSEKTISITPDSGWGSDTAACPADIVVPMRTRGAQPAVFSYQPVCKAADMFRPVIIGMAWLFAVLIAIGVARRGE